MKANFRIPYPFLDLKNRYKNKIKTEIKNDYLLISIDRIEKNIFHENFLDEINIGLEIQCSSTLYRKFFEIEFEEYKIIKIPLNDVLRDVELKVLALAKMDISEYYISEHDFHSFIEVGSVLAIFFDKKISIEDYGGDYSGLVKATRHDENYIDYDVSNDYLLIKIPDKEFDYFESLLNDTENLPIIYAAFVKPCFIHACHQIIAENADDRLWVTVLKENVDSADDEFIQEDEIPKFTEELLNLCSSKAIGALSNLHTDEEDCII